MQMIIN